MPLDIIVPTQMQLDTIILNQTRLQINMRPVYTDIELYREIENQRISARNYRDNLNGLHYVNHGRNASNFHEIIVPEQTCGSMTNKCIHCGAKFFNCERNSAGKYTTCCHEGKVKLPSISVPTALMQELFLGNTTKSKLFLKHPRFYNNHLSFASITMDEG